MAKRTVQQIISSGFVTDAESAETGITRKALPVIQFTDNLVNKSWYARSFIELGTADTLIGDDGNPLDQDLLAKVRDFFGSDASVVW